MRGATGRGRGPDRLHLWDPTSSGPPGSSPASWFAGPKEAVKRPPSIPVAEPIDVDWWTLFHDPILTGLERRVAAENLDVKIAGVRLAESRAQLADRAGVVVSDGRGQRVLRARTRQQQRRIRPDSQRHGRECRERSSRQFGRRDTGHRPRHRSISIRAASMRPGRSICGAAYAARSNRPRRHQPKRPMRPDASVLLSSLAEVARDYILLRGVQTELQIAHDNVGYATSEPQPDPAAGRRRRHHRSRCGERLGAVAQHAGADSRRWSSRRRS